MFVWSNVVLIAWIWLLFSCWVLLDPVLCLFTLWSSHVFYEATSTELVLRLCKHILFGCCHFFLVWVAVIYCHGVFLVFRHPFAGSPGCLDLFLPNLSLVLVVLPVVPGSLELRSLFLCKVHFVVVEVLFCFTSLQTRVFARLFVQILLVVLILVIIVNQGPKVARLKHLRLVSIKSTEAFCAMNHSVEHWCFKWNEFLELIFLPGATASSLNASYEVFAAFNSLLDSLAEHREVWWQSLGRTLVYVVWHLRWLLHEERCLVRVKVRSTHAECREFPLLNLWYTPQRVIAYYLTNRLTATLGVAISLTDLHRAKVAWELLLKSVLRETNIVALIIVLIEVAD